MPRDARIEVDLIAHVEPAGRERAVIDLFLEAGTPPPGTEILDVLDRFRVDLILIRQTPRSGARVLATRQPPRDDVRTDRQGRDEPDFG
ncbi:hypothetical protein [Deinococcus aquiradiocola]|uniref:Uncharacterized protein n=1 Tax=Deinococcus aquiradiocola TaxID=393059 RepID=A0A917PB97_9DEIO|nr:hypothetical protein [Deinococcus aquiradiocola]GGJ69601.1 hypothetical protein GCM10008939_12490 [Deinococcus aquiradiocola]